MGVAEISLDNPADKGLITIRMRQKGNEPDEDLIQGKAARREEALSEARNARVAVRRERLQASKDGARVMVDVLSIRNITIDDLYSKI